MANWSVVRFLEIKVPTDDPVVPYAHSVPVASTTQGESMMIPVGAPVAVRLPGDAIVACA